MMNHSEIISLNMSDNVLDFSYSYNVIKKTEFLDVSFNCSKPQTRIMAEPVIQCHPTSRLINAERQKNRLENNMNATAIITYWAPDPKNGNKIERWSGT